VTDLELQELRRQKWRLDGRAVHTLEDAREFLDSVGFCLMYPERQPVLVPTFIGAYVGSDEKLPTSQHAYADPRAREATELMVRLLRDKSAFEAKLFGENIFLISASVFPYFYGLVGDRNPRQVPKAGAPAFDDAGARQAGALRARPARQGAAQLCLPPQPTGRKPFPQELCGFGQRVVRLPG
jgi:hypothetical protein